MGFSAAYASLYTSQQVQVDEELTELHIRAAKETTATSHTAGEPMAVDDDAALPSEQPRLTAEERARLDESFIVCDCSTYAHNGKMCCHILLVAHYLELVDLCAFM